MGLSSEEVAQWLRESCLAQGVPVRIEDQATAAKVAKLLRSGKPKVRFSKSA
jgi:hypothetical protein